MWVNLMVRLHCHILFDHLIGRSPRLFQHPTLTLAPNDAQVKKKSTHALQGMSNNDEDILDKVDEFGIKSKEIVETFIQAIRGLCVEQVKTSGPH